MDIKIIHYPINYKNIIYEAGRNCYGINNEIAEEDKLDKFIYNIIKNNHESVLEHINITILIENIPRSLMEQLTRHRLCSFSIKSTHYVNHKNFTYYDFYSVLGEQYKQLMKRIQNLYEYYVDNNKIPHYLAREILPNSCLTNIIMTTNIREYRYIIKQRITKNNIPLMQDFSKLLCRNLYLICPECFNDIIDNEELI